MGSEEHGSAVYVIEINGKVYRKSLPNRFQRISTLKRIIKEYFELDYDFELQYKDAILLDSDSFCDLRIKTSEPIRVRPKTQKPLRRQSVQQQYSDKSEAQDLYTNPTSTYQTTTTTDENPPISDDSEHNLNDHEMQLSNSFTLRGETDFEIEILSRTESYLHESPHDIIEISSETDDSLESMEVSGRNLLIMPRQLTLEIDTLNKSHSVQIFSDFTFQKLWLHMCETPGYNSADTPTDLMHPLFFNRRMHIFIDAEEKDDGFENYWVPDFFLDDEQLHQLFLYTISKEKLQNLYAYQTNPEEIFADSDWWVSQTPSLNQVEIAQSMLLTSLFALHHYFRASPKDEISKRQVLELSLITVVQKYLFPPAVQALVHAMHGTIFVYEKTLLYDSLLHLLQKFCPLSVPESQLGTYMPHLICWLFEQCTMEVTESPPYSYIDLSINVASHEKHRRIDKMVKTDQDGFFNAGRYPAYKTEKDIELFLKFKERNKELCSSPQFNANEYALMVSNETNSDEIVVQQNGDDIMALFETMVIKYPSFALRTRKDVRKDLRHQIVLLINNHIVFAFTPTIDITDCPQPCYPLFDPFRKIGKAKENEFYVYDGRKNKKPQLDPLLLMSLRISRLIPDYSMQSVYKDLSLIIVVVIDICNPTIRHHNVFGDRDTFMNIVRDLLNALSGSIDSAKQESVISIIQCLSNPRVLCSITKETHDFKRAISYLEYRTTISLSRYEGLLTGLENIRDFQRDHNLTMTKISKLIVWITNYFENEPGQRLRRLISKARAFKTAISLASFLPNYRDLQNAQSRIQLQHMKDLCTETKGTVYRIEHFSAHELADKLTEIHEICVTDRGENGDLPNKHLSRQGHSYRET